MKISAHSARSGHTVRSGKCLVSLGSALFLWVGVSTAAGAQVYLPPLGGGGGGQFKAPCGAGQSLGGVELRVADDVDAMRPVCVMAYGPGRTGDEAVPPAWNGGPGGVRVERLLCPSAKPVVLAISIGAEGEKTIIVNNVHLFCGLAVTTDQALEEYPSAIFDGPGYRPSPKFVGLGFDAGSSNRRYSSQRCPAGEVAVGVHGASGVWLNSMALICDAPHLSKPPVSLGRNSGQSGSSQSVQKNKPKPVIRQNAPSAMQAKTPMPTVPGYQTICQAAAAARAKNSPAADGLGAQCRALRAKAGKP